ncbi:MAG: PIN domain-containing protein [Polyangiaceae bacterium]
MKLDPGVAVFLDTSLVVAATVEVHPSHKAAADFVDDLVSGVAQPCISPQICREFLVVLTRQPVSGRVFSRDEAIAALQVWVTGCVMLGEDEVSVHECVRLVRQQAVLGKQVHDCNIVATMLAHGVRRLATRNPGDFKRFHSEVSVVAVLD